VGNARVPHLGKVNIVGKAKVPHLDRANIVDTRRVRGQKHAHSRSAFPVFTRGKLH